MTTIIGFIGLGAMGAPMLRRMAAARGEEAVLGYDADTETAKRICSQIGVEACGSLAGIAERSDVMVTCVPNDAVVRAVYLDHDGLARSARPGSVTMDCSTVSPGATRDVHEHLLSLGIDHLDTSMLGSVKQAIEGTISFLVGGNEDALERAKPVLDELGGLVRYCGPSGSGNSMKLIHQTLVAGHAVAVAEALTLCRETGVDIDTFYDIVTQGTGFAYSRYFEQRVPRMMSGDFSPLFMLRFMAKDARLARDMVADVLDDPAAMLPALQAAISTLEEGEQDGLGDLDFSATLKVLERRTSRLD